MADHILGLFFIYSIAMFTVPLITFFGAQEILKREFHVEGFNNAMWSVIFAVATVNIIIVLYARRAYQEEFKEERKNQESRDAGEVQPIDNETLKKND